jgi:hypothetical protein
LGELTPNSTPRFAERHCRQNRGHCASTLRRTLGDTGQTAIVLVVGLTILLSTIGAILVQSAITAGPLQQTQSTNLYAYRALQAGVNSYLTAINQNPSLAQCDSQTNTAGTCQGLQYDSWNMVANSSSGSEGDTEWYAFGNPQPTFTGTTNQSSLAYITITVYGAAHSLAAANNYVFQQQTIQVAPDNGFLDHVYWTNYESSNSTGEYWYTAGGTATTTPTTSTINPVSPDPGCYNYSNITYTDGAQNNYSGPQGLCSGDAVYFGPNDIVDGPVYSNDSIYISGSPTFGPSGCSTNTAAANPCYAVQTADPGCLFVAPDPGGHGGATGLGMDGTNTNCGSLNSSVNFGYNNLYEGTGSTTDGSTTPPPNTNCTPTSGSRYNCAYSQPPADDSSLSTLAAQNGCLYEGPISIVLSVVGGVGKMTVESPGDPSYPNDSTTLLNAGNTNTCPTNGTTAVNLPQNGIVYDQAGGSSPAGANPFDGTSQFYSTHAPQTSTTCSGCYSGQTGSFNTEADAFVAGNLSGQLTIGSTQNIVIDGNLTYNDCVGKWVGGGNVAGGASESTCPLNTGASPTNDVLGLISDGYVEVDHPVGALTSYSSNSLDAVTQCSTFNGNSGTYCTAQVKGSFPATYVTCPTYTTGSTNSCAAPLPQCATTVVESLASCDPANTSEDGTADSLSVDAAILALDESFVVNNDQWVNSNGTSDGYLNIYGSIAQFARGAVGTFGTLATGYTKYYTWDPLLDYIAPPSYLKPVDNAWTLASTPTATQSPTFSCPSAPASWDSGQAANNTFCSTAVSTGATTLPSYG